MSNLKSIRFLHLIDHNGTIFSLVSPLSIYPEHKVITSFSNSKEKTIQTIKKISKEKGLILILHATGNKKFFYNMKEELIKDFKKIYIFLHVSPKHFFIKNRKKEFEKIKRLVQEGKVKILTPSKTLKKEFLRYGIKSIPIQIGLNLKIKKNLYKKEKKFISTVCTSNKDIYRYIKGIDIFIKIVKDLNLEKESIILGDNSRFFKGIKTKEVPKNQFLRYLRESKIYLQLSRTESYNTSAIYAKRLKIPIVVSNIEGHIDNVKYGFRVNNIKEAERVLKKILDNPRSRKIKDILNKNYKDSVQRESLRNFRDSFTKLLSK